MYQVGDIVVYGNTGVCRITEISEQKIPGSVERKPYYTLSACHQQCVIHTPVDNPKVLMRPIISKDEAERLIDSLPSLQTTPCQGKASGELAEQYRQTIRSNSCADLLVLTKSLYAKKIALEGQKRKYGSVDERYMRRAEELLFGELSMALDIDLEEVASYISSRVEASVQ
ncbi:MAG: CarD family transcriptional regulator [Oscillospiraceae bacterium]